MVQLGKRKGGDVAAIFVHAGAGYHSLHNEKNHLKACEDATRAAMAFLKNGAPAVDAVEIAIKILEDNEITNAGYGSNLTEEGFVEADACIVDHHGRSGAVGAIRSVANPIHVARLVLDESQKPLSLRRVPPNLICGDGASDFAFTHGVSLLPNDVITSASARERWAKWKKDLENVRETPEETVMSSTVHIADPTTGVERPVNVNSRELAGLSIDSQPISPRPNVQKDPLLTLRTPSHTPDAAHRSTAVPSGRSGLPRLSYSYQPARDTMKSPPRSPLPHGHPMGDFHQSLSDEDPTPHVDPNPQELFRRFRGQVDSQAIASIEEDMVTDTVGAIAIDCYGNIAAASSSGGIGMKHRGRIGPAALVGIGTSVIPAPVGDLSKTVVATVTSGTGEHMATTNAAHMCAYALSRNSTYWENKGHFIDESDDEIIKNFIDNDFMEHPSVQKSSHIGAIGIMAVKKSLDGIWLYFAHNTSSFALASMSTEDEAPRTVMSRASKHSDACTFGGLAFKFVESETKRRKKEEKSNKLEKKSRSQSMPMSPRGP